MSIRAPRSTRNFTLNSVSAFHSDIDAELAVLEARSDKPLALKQAMMQELLTGRIRLI